MSKRMGVGGWLNVVVSTLLLLGVAAGCGGSASTASAGPVPIEQFAARFAADWCDNVGACCQAGAWSFDLASCKKNAELGFGSSLVAPAVQSPSTVHYDASAAGACLQAFTALVQSCDASGVQSIEPACSVMLIGTQPQGAACTMNEECAPSKAGPVHCSGAPSDPGGMPGVCVVEPSLVITHGKAGDECVGTCAANDAPCGISDSSRPNAVPCFVSDGVYCQTPSLTCQPLGDLGQSCSLGGCVAGAFCDSGSCVAQRDSGPCQVGGDSCSAHSFCNSDSGECEPRRANGSPCQDDSWCQVNQCVFPESNGAGGANTGTCSTDSLANNKACSGALG